MFIKVFETIFYETPSLTAGSRSALWANFQEKTQMSYSFDECIRNSEFGDGVGFRSEFFGVARVFPDKNYG